MLNHIVIMGRLTRDPELRYTNSNVPVASLSVAVDRDFGKDPDGNKQTDFFECVAWRQTGEFISKYFSKGSMIVLEGQMQSRRWTDRDGGKRLSWELIVDHAYFGGSKREGDGGSSGGSAQAPGRSSGSPQPAQSSWKSPQHGTFVDLDDDEDDGELPF